MKRLADDPGAPIDLRAMIAAARSDAPAPAVLERMLGRIERGGGGSTPPGGGAGRRVLVAGGAGIAVVAALFILRAGGGDAGRGGPVAPPPPPPMTAEPAAVPAVVSSLPDEPVAVDLPAPPAKRRARTRRPSPVAVEAPPPPSEVSLVERARAQLAAADFAAASAAAAEHQARYPQGVLAEEREAIAVEALARAGRTGEARARLAGFLRRYPRSSYRRHLEEALR